MRVLIMGLPGSGKTTLANAIADDFRKRRISATVINADDIRSRANDWDFTRQGRLRQAQRIDAIASGEMAHIVIMDFVAALPEQREVVRPDVTVWMNTVNSCAFADTHAAFIGPESADIIFSGHNTGNLDAAIAALVLKERVLS